MSHFTCKDYSVQILKKICTEYLVVLKNILRSTETVNTKDYPLLLFEEILQIPVKKAEKIFIKIIQYIIFEDLHINIGNKSSPTLIFDILCYTTQNLL